MSTCTFNEMLSPYLDDVLPQEDKGRLEDHLETCLNCKRELKELRLTLEFLHDLPAAQVPADLARSITMEVAARRHKKLSFLPPKILSMQYVMPLGGVVLAMAIALFMWSDQILLPSLESPSAQSNRASGDAGGDGFTLLRGDETLDVAMEEAEADPSDDQFAVDSEMEETLDTTGRGEFQDQPAEKSTSRQRDADSSPGANKPDVTWANDSFAERPEEKTKSTEHQDSMDQESYVLGRENTLADLKKTESRGAEFPSRSAEPAAPKSLDKAEDVVLYAEAGKLGHTFRVTVAFPEQDMVAAQDTPEAGRDQDNQPLSRFAPTLESTEPAAQVPPSPSLADDGRRQKEKTNKESKDRNLAGRAITTTPDPGKSTDKSGLVATGDWTQPILKARPNRPKKQGRLWVLVGLKGQAEKAQDLEGEPLNLSEYSWIGALTFEPATKDGKPISAWVLLEPVSYTLDGAESEAGP